LHSSAIQKVIDPISKMWEKNQDANHTFQLRCYECGKEMSTPYKSYILSLGDCCGLEPIDFCSEDCLDQYKKRMGD